MNNITNPKFFTGGRATFTVTNNKGEHYTFRISHSKPTQPLFVSLLTGPCNESNYTYMGIFSPEQNEVKLTKASKFNNDSTPVKVVRWAIKQVGVGVPLPTGYSIQHAGKCCCCGRQLTDPISIAAGIGPECAGRAGWGR